MKKKKKGRKSKQVSLQLMQIMEVKKVFFLRTTYHAKPGKSEHLELGEQCSKVCVLCNVPLPVSTREGGKPAMACCKQFPNPNEKRGLK